MKIIRKIYHWCTKTRIRKILSSIMALLIFLTSIKYIFIPAIPTKAADILIKLDEGYGTAPSDTNSTVSAGTITNATWKSEELCRFSKCLYFDGTGDYVSYADNSNFDMGSGETVTVEGWFRTPDITSGTRTLISKEEATGADGGYRIEMDSNGFIRFGIDNDNASFPSDSVTSTVAYDDNIWHHFAAVKDGSTSITLYIDGVSVGTPDSSIQNDVSNNDSFYIGSYFDVSASNGFSGFIDDIKVMRTARTAAQVKTDYTSETRVQGAAATFGGDQAYISNGLLGYWKLDETSGNAADASGNGLTLTNNGTTTYVAGKFGYGSEHVPASTQYLSTATTITGVKTVSFWTNPDSTTNYMISLTSGAYITASSGTITATGFTNPTIYVNGAVSSTLTQDVWQIVTVTTDTAIDANQFYVGRQGSNYYDGTLDEVRLYNRAFSSSETRQLYTWAPGPIAHFKLDEHTGTTTVNDSSGNGYNGTMFGSKLNTDWVTGQYGSGLKFDGVNDGVDFYSSTFNTAFLPTYGTISFWWRYPDSASWALGGNPNAINIAADANNIVEVRRDTTNIQFFYTAGGTQVEYQVTTQPTAWIHLEMTWDKAADEVRYYANGIYQQTDTGLGTWAGALSSSRVVLGSRTNAAADPFDGQLDDVRVYNYPRTASQVLEDYNAGQLAPGGPVGSTVGSWKFDEGALNTCSGGTNDFCDTSGNTNDLAFSTSTGGWTNAGKFGKAMNATGAVWATRADDADFDFSATDDLSMSFWFKADAANKPSSGNVQYLYTKGTITSAGTVGYVVYANSSGNINFGIRSTSGNWVATAPAEPTSNDKVTSTADLYDSAWHHIVLEKTATSRIDLYVDSLLNASDTSLAATGTLANSIASRFADRDATDNGDEFIGTLDEMKIFRSPLNSDAVRVLYNQSSQTSFGSLSTDSSGNVDNSIKRSYCPPGNTEGNCGSGDPSPAGEWKLDENTGSTSYDTSGNANNGVITNNGPTFWQPGKLGSAMSTINADATVTVNTINDPAGGELDFSNSQDFTLSAWIKFTTQENTQSILIYKGGNSDTEAGYNLDVNSSNLFRCNYADTAVGTREQAISTTTANDGVWHHIECVMDRNGSEVGTTGFHIFVDGRLEASDTSLTEGTGVSSKTLQIGETTGSFEFTAAIDNVQIFPYARSRAQIGWDYNRGGPIGWWKMDESSWNGTSGEVKDSSGNSYNLTAGGNATTTTSSTKYNNSGTYDGSGDYTACTDAVCGGTTKLDFPTTPKASWGAWFKSNASGLKTIMGKRNTTNTSDAGYVLYQNSSDQAACKLGDGTHDVQVSSTATISDSTWHHAMCVTDGSTMTLYLDGVSVNSGSVTTVTGTIDNAIDFRTGTSGAGANSWSGQIDDPRVYNYNLTAQQVKTIMNNNSALRFGP